MTVIPVLRSDHPAHTPHRESMTVHVSPHGAVALSFNDGLEVRCLLGPLLDALNNEGSGARERHRSHDHKET